MNAIVKRVIFALALVMTVLLGAAVTKDSQPVADGTYKLVSAVDEGYAWDIDASSTDEEANLQLYQDNGSESQKFIFTYHSDGYYTILNAHSGKVIECSQGASEDGSNIWQYTGNHTDAQRWKLFSAGDGWFALKCKCNGKVADIEESIAQNGQNIQMYQFNDTAAQKFRLIKVTAGSQSLVSNEAAKVPAVKVILYKSIALLLLAAMAGIIWAGYRRQK